MNLIWNIIRFIQRSGVALKNQTLKNINRIRVRTGCYEKSVFPVFYSQKQIALEP